ncbi:MAG: MBL fold metallo-hydrolase [Chloroflexota bacterium]|nr:MBL fold metallo-hydrolase [Chloroflexota bacterium]
MRITFCGSGAGGSVNPRRGAASIHLAHGDARILVDAGPGFMERMVDSGLDADAVSDVVLSHLHFDHAMGVVELFTRLIVRRGAPVTVFGPRDTDTYMEAALAFARVNATSDFIRRWLDGVSVELTRPGDEREIGGMEVRSVEVPHAPYLECLARRFEAGGRSLVYTGDTTYAPEALVPLADGADVLVHEAYTESCLERMAEGLSEAGRQGLFRGVAGTHSTAESAGRIARDAGVGTLVLTHIMSLERDWELVEEARRAYDGTIVVATDGMSLEV